MIKFDNSWDKIFSNPKFTPNFESYCKFIDDFYEKFGKSINPSKENVFKVFKLCPIESIKVVFLGQDPYPGKGVADGLAFSTLTIIKHLFHFRILTRKLVMNTMCK